MSLSTQQLQQYIETYVPEIRLHPSEIYLPASVDWYLQNTTLTLQTGGQPLGPPAAPTSANSPEAFLTIVGQRISADKVERGDLSTAVLYTHTVRPTEDPSAYDLQYWLFYPFNGPATVDIFNTVPPFQPALVEIPPVGDHEGDWEHVTVRIDDSGTILGVFGSQHGRGTWYVEATAPGAKDGYTLNASGQPIMYSAINTHANYAWPGEFTVPESFFDLRLFQFRIVDRSASSGPVWPSVTPQEVESQSWAGFPGHYGPILEESLTSKELASILAEAIPLLPENLAQDIAQFLAGVLPADKENGPTGPTQKTPAWAHGDAGGPAPNMLFSAVLSAPGPLAGQETRSSGDFNTEISPSGTQQLYWRALDMQGSPVSGVEFNVYVDVPVGDDYPLFLSLSNGSATSLIAESRLYIGNPSGSAEPFLVEVWAVGRI